MIFERLTSFLQHAASVSLVFFPSTSGSKNKTDVEIKRESRGRHLQSIFEIDKNNSLYDRNLRNHLTHTDERIDLWCEKSKSRNQFRYNVGPIEGILNGPNVDSILDYFEHFDADTNKFIFRGEVYDLSSIAASLSIVKDKAENLMSHKFT